jgi:hypothetical protein
MKVILLALILISCSFHALADSSEAFDGRKWTYYGGYEFPGAEGNVQRTEVDDRDAVALSYDFSAGGAYVACQVPVNIMESDRVFSFAAKCEVSCKLTLRIKDSQGQIHTYKPVYEEAGEWKNFEFDLRDDVAGHFGGPNDGVIHFPLLQVTLGVNKGETTMTPGQVYFAAPKK